MKIPPAINIDDLKYTVRFFPFSTADPSFMSENMHIYSRIEIYVYRTSSDISVNVIGQIVSVFLFLVIKSTTEAKTFTWNIHKKLSK